MIIFVYYIKISLFLTIKFLLCCKYFEQIYKTFQKYGYTALKIILSTVSHTTKSRILRSREQNNKNYK